jgi:hypothetical protein
MLLRWLLMIPQSLPASPVVFFYTSSLVAYDSTSITVNLEVGDDVVDCGARETFKNAHVAGIGMTTSTRSAMRASRNERLAYLFTETSSARANVRKLASRIWSDIGEHELGLRTAGNISRGTTLD